MCPQEQDNSGNIYFKKGRKKDRKENKTTSEERLNESRGCYNLSLLEGQQLGKQETSHKIFLETHANATLGRSFQVFMRKRENER